MTTPAMLLASAIHRWWPTNSRPAVADLGYYFLLNTPKDLPVIANSGGVVIVQDILDTSQVSNTLIKPLRDQGIEILGVLAFIQFVSDIVQTRATGISEGWIPSANGQTEDFIPRHALIEVKRPLSVQEPKDIKENISAFWIEPRSLRALPYAALRRDYKPGKDLDLDRRDKYLQRFDNPIDGCLLTSGHYVYGRRHYAVTVDIRRALTGPIGDEIAHWIADLCEGVERSEKSEWERSEGFKLKNGVTAVLMPLHSQIHYIWPTVENLLAQRGRRQPNWWLEATLFTGSAPAYLIPAQVQYQIEEAVKATKEIDNSTQELVPHPLRILILDDAIATARTAETILATLLREIERAFEKAGKKIEICTKPVEWIRYFAVLNQMGRAHHVLWRNIQAIGKLQIPVVFEEFAPFMGVPIYDEENCPFCNDRRRLSYLAARCKQHVDEVSKQWAQLRVEELHPIAVDSPNFLKQIPSKLPQPIDVLAHRATKTVKSGKYQLLHADSAIWRFHELMYLSYPPNDVLRSLSKAREPVGERKEIIREYERYRWAVLDWCLHNWPRVIANVARKDFIECALEEVNSNSQLVIPLVEGCSMHYRDPYIRPFIVGLIMRLGQIELQRRTSKGLNQDRIEQSLQLDTALNIFFLSVPLNELDQLVIDEGENGYSTLLSKLNQVAIDLDVYGPSFVRNLYRKLTRPQSYADPAWALEALAEAIFRGRDPQNAPAGNHKLLPRLISDVLRNSGKNREERRLLHGSLALFVAALEDLKPYCDLTASPSAVQVESLSRKVLEWLEPSLGQDAKLPLPPELRYLSRALDPNEAFCNDINAIFHEDLEYVRRALLMRLDDPELVSDNLEFSYIIDEGLQDCRVLIPIHGLTNCLANIAIDPIREAKDKCRSQIAISLSRNERLESRLRFRILTNFIDNFEEARRRISEGRSGLAERDFLRKFGASFQQLMLPTKDEMLLGYTIAFEFDVMVGFMPKRRNV